MYEDVPLGRLNTFPDFRLDLKSRFPTGDRAVLEWVMSGTHEGNLPQIATTYKAMSIRVTAALRAQRFLVSVPQQQRPLVMLPFGGGSRSL